MVSRVVRTREEEPLARVEPRTTRVVFPGAAPARQEELLRPFHGNSRAFYVAIAFLGILVLWFLYAWYTQLTQGLGATALRTPVGSAWGVYISNFVFFASMAHGGMAISAAVRLLKLRQFASVARIGEVVTAVALGMAGLSIVIDLGRPDRALNMILFWPWRVATSPLAWDMTVLLLYFTLSTSYLWLTMRRDLHRIAGRFSGRGILYRLLLRGYRAEDEPAVHRTAWWLSIAILILIVMLSGGVIPWIFGLLPGRPGWFGAMAGPYFLTASLASSVAIVCVIAGILRKVYGWQSHIRTEAFRGLGIALAVLTHFYIYLTIAEQFTMLYASPHAESVISETLLKGPLSVVFWPTLVFGFAIPAVVLTAQAFYPTWFSVTRTALVAAVILVAFWVKRFLIVVPSLLRPLLPFPTGTYVPSWVEWSVIVGIFALATLLYIGCVKIFPIVELGEE